MGITTSEMIIPKKLFKAKVEKDLEFDATLADFCPDIARLVRVDCTPFSENCTVDGDKIVINGKAVYDVLYETDYKNKLKYCSFTQEFNHSVPMPRSGASNSAAFCRIKCERIGCKLLSPRRLIIKAALGIILNAEGETAVKTVAVTDSDETFFRKKTIGFDGRTNEFSETFRFDDSLQLSQNEKNIGEIVFGSIVLQEPQTVFSPGQADIKTVATVKAVCEDENEEGKYFSVSKTLPLDMSFNNNAIEDFKEMTVRLEAESAEFKPDLDQYGESRVINANFAVKMKMQINEPKAYTVAEDLFEKGFDSVCTMGSASVPKVFSRTKTSFSAESKLSDMLPKPVAILDATARETEVRTEAADGGINLSGGFTVTLLADTQEGIHSFDRTVTYEQFIQTDIPEGEIDITAEVYPIEVIAALHSDGTATARVIAGVNLELNTSQEETFVADVAKRTPKENITDEPTLIYRFPQKNEDAWSIAKSYGADPEAVISSNPDAFDENGKTSENSKPILIKI